MKLVVGLGNPGKKYKKTRHNVGFLVLEKLKAAISNFEFLISDQRSRLRRKQIPSPKFQMSKNANALCMNFGTGEKRIELLKPQTFMNKSGFSVAYARNKHKVSNDDVYVIHDDLDIKLGEYKIQLGKGPKDHNGLISVDEALGTRQYWHVRIGINNHESRITNHGSRIHGEDYVLMNFTKDEESIIDGLIKEVLEELKERLRDG